MKMPVVNECAVDACAYNLDGACHALAITVGNGPQAAHCDTYFRTSARGGDPSHAGHVGACKMSGCLHNVDLECQAPGISVGFVQDGADCLTYAHR